MTEHVRSAPLVSYHGGHTLFDGKGDPEAFIEAALVKGFTALGFTEHMPAPARYPYPFPAQPDWATASRMFDQYVTTITRLQAAYRGDLPVLVGVETEYLPDEETYLADFLERYPFDYVLGSVHFVAGVGFDWSPEWYERAARICGGYEPLAVEYYRMVRGLLAMDVSDVLGHLDLIKVFSPEPITGPEVAEAERETLEAARKADVILDVNPRGLIKPCRQIYPRTELLAQARRLGIPATLGDDSHAPDEVGARLDDAVAAMREAGYTSLSVLLLDGHQIRRQELPL